MLPQITGKCVLQQGQLIWNTATLDGRSSNQRREIERQIRCCEFMCGNRRSIFRLQRKYLLTTPKWNQHPLSSLDLWCFFFLPNWFCLQNLYAAGHYYSTALLLWEEDPIDNEKNFGTVHHKLGNTCYNLERFHQAEQHYFKGKRSI